MEFIDKKMSLDTIIILKIFWVGKFLFYRKDNVLILICYMFVKLVYRVLEIIYGFSFPFSTTVGKNICFKHGMYGIFISSEAIIGDDVIIMHQVTIGSNYSSSKPITAPIIGNNVFIGVGAKIIGKVTIENNVRIGANSLIVDQNCPKGIYVSSRAYKLNI